MTKWISPVLLAALLWPAQSLACGADDVCTDVSSSFSGEVMTEVGIRVTWDTNDEDSEVTEYKLYRYDCGTPSTCLTWVASINPRGYCTQSEYYTYTDSPPGDLEDWDYRLRVFDGFTQVCEYDVDPE